MSTIQIAVLAPLLCACMAGDSYGDSGSAAVAALQERRPTVGEVFADVHTSVVTIGTIGRTGVRDASGQVATEAGIGSGVLVSPEGKILTASHVVQTADEVAVGFVDGTVVRARVLSSDPSADVALLMLTDAPPSSAHIAAVGNSDDMSVGQPIFVVGAPQGLVHTLTVGHVSARRTNVSPLRPKVEIERFQTDAAINQGNSGGPMFNLDGEVVGIVSYIVSRSGGSDGLGFAITSNVCRELLLDRPPVWTGMDYVVVTGPLAGLLNLPDGKSGLLIQRIAKGSPAEKLGLQGGSIPIKLGDMEFLLGGDVIVEVFGIGLDEEGGLARITEQLVSLPQDGYIELVHLRGGTPLKVHRRRDKVGI